VAQADNNQEFCRERVLRANPLFRVSHLFTPADFAGQVLALHALFASIDQLNSEIGDEFVARRKLDWWRTELSPENISKSNHPVVRYLIETGAASSLPGKTLELFLDTAEVRLAARAPTDQEELSLLCESIYQPRVLMECALSQDETPVFGLSEMAKTGGLLQLMRERNISKNNILWWVPLNVLARFGATRAGLGNDPDSQNARGVFEAVFGSCNKLNSQQAISGQENMAPSRGLVHLRVLALLQSRQLDQLRKIRPSSYPGELNRWRFADLLVAWNAARQLMQYAG
jgi:phytoene synthase